VSASRSAAQTTGNTVATSLDYLQAMARHARETGLVVHVVVARSPGVVECARQTAGELGLGCSVDLRAQTARIRFDATESDPRG
jgi:hypothetical protein